jgi:hypothetical protein
VDLQGPTGYLLLSRLTWSRTKGGLIVSKGGQRRTLFLDSEGAVRVEAYQRIGPPVPRGVEIVTGVLAGTEEEIRG